jgi:transposase-like protein
MVRRLEGGEPVQAVATALQLSRQTIPRWWRRYQAEGPAGLEDRPLLALRRIQDRARREGKAGMTSAEIHRVIREVRRERARVDAD